MTAPARGAEGVSGARTTALTELAEKGEFERVLGTLRTLDGTAADPQAANLIRDLERFHEHRSRDAAARQKASQKHLDSMAEEVAADRLEQALKFAIDAHGQSLQPAELLENAEVRALVQRAEAAADQAARDGQWLDVLGLYRSLDLLYLNEFRYRARARQAEQHVRLLRLYHPAALQDLYAQRATRQGKENPEPIKLGRETWEDRLAGIRQPMLQEVLKEAARRHISSDGYAGLLRGGVDSLLLLLDAKALTATFPNLNNPLQVTRFRDHLLSLRQSLDQRKAVLTYLDVARAIDGILAINAITLDLPERVVIYELGEGAMGTLDEFTSVIWPRDLPYFQRNMLGNFYGVGIQISLSSSKDPTNPGHERLTVVTPLENTPAHKAGIKAGDVIIRVNGKETHDWSLDQAVNEITGPEGTEVVLTIERPGAADPLNFRLRRAEIVIESIRGWEHKPAGGWNYTIDQNFKIGYIRLSQFIPRTTDDLDEALTQMQKEGDLNALILDLRFNPGGLLTKAVEVTDRFIRSGPIVATVGPNGQKIHGYDASPHKTYANFPVVVLINQGSASASEIVAGALQDYQRATIIGGRSFGKASVQDLFPIDGNKAVLKLTTNYYRLPKGRIIHRKPDARTWGIEPDLVVEMTDQQVLDEMQLRRDVDVLRDQNDAADPEKPLPQAGQILDKGLDPQLQAALLVLKTKLVAERATMAKK